MKVNKSYISYRTEIKLTEEQKKILLKNKHAQHWVWNLYIATNQEGYKNNQEYRNNYEFSKWFNNEFLKTEEGEKYKWIKDKEVSSANIRNTMRLCDQAFQKFFKTKKGFPRFKKFIDFEEGYYFTRVQKKQLVKCFRHKIKVPLIGWVVLKEKGYIPYKGNKIMSGTITNIADRYFISVLVEEELTKFKRSLKDKGIGIDLGIKDLMVCSSGEVFPNINKSIRVKKLEKSLRRQQRSLSRKQEFQRKEKRSLRSKNYMKNQLIVQRLNYKLTSIRKAYINKCVDYLIEKKPKFIVVEDLNIQGMLKNKHLSKAIKDMLFYYTKQILIQKCNKHGIEVREVNRFFPSSKTCAKCGNVKKQLKLSERTYKCEKCGLNLDRDLNASINLKNAINYKILTTGGLLESNACGVLNQTVVPFREVEHREARRSQIIKEKRINKKRNLLYYKWTPVYV